MRAAIVKDGFNLERAEKAILEYRKYLYTIVHVNGLAPTPDVDIVWHYHCLDMVRYQKDCLETFGRMIYHTPNSISDEKVQEVLQRNIQELPVSQTLQLADCSCGNDACIGCTDCEAERKPKKNKVLFSSKNGEVKMVMNPIFVSTIKSANLKNFSSISKSFSFT